LWLIWVVILLTVLKKPLVSYKRLACVEGFCFESIAGFCYCLMDVSIFGWSASFLFEESFLVESSAEARIVLGWGNAWEEFRVLSAFCCDHCCS
jgi:hypothetical protein